MDYATDRSHLLGEPETTIDCYVWSFFPLAQIQVSSDHFHESVPNPLQKPKAGEIHQVHGIYLSHEKKTGPVVGCFI